MIAPIANDPSDALEFERLDDVRFLAAFSQFFAVSRDLGATLETALTGIIVQDMIKHFPVSCLEPFRTN